MPVKLLYCLKTMFPFAKFIFANKFARYESKFLRNFAFYRKNFRWKPYYVFSNADEGIPKENIY